MRSSRSSDSDRRRVARVDEPARTLAGNSIHNGAVARVTRPTSVVSASSFSSAREQRRGVAGEADGGAVALGALVAQRPHLQPLGDPARHEADDARHQAAVAVERADRAAGERDGPAGERDVVAADAGDLVGQHRLELVARQLVARDRW